MWLTGFWRPAPGAPESCAPGSFSVCVAQFAQCPLCCVCDTAPQHCSGCVLGVQGHSRAARTVRNFTLKLSCPQNILINRSNLYRTRFCPCTILERAFSSTHCSHWCESSPPLPSASSAPGSRAQGAASLLAVPPSSLLQDHLLGAVQDPGGVRPVPGGLLGRAVTHIAPPPFVAVAVTHLLVDEWIRLWLLHC